MDKPCIIIGGGGHTRVLIGMFAGENLQGIITSDRALLGTEILETKVLGLEHEVALDPEAVLFVNGVGNKASREGSGMAGRIAVYERYRQLGCQFATLLSKQALVQPHVMLEDGVQVMPGAVIQPGSVIGANSIINTRACIDHDVRIGAHVHVAPGAVLCGNVTVGAGTHIGAGAVVIQGITIGANVVIGAGAVVTCHVPDNTIVRPAASESAPLKA